MSGVASLVGSYVPVVAGEDAAGQRPKTDAQAIAVAKQAVDQAQGRVDADRRAHSPGCVAVDQKGVDKASAEVARLQAQANAATVGNQSLSISA